MMYFIKSLDYLQSEFEEIVTELSEVLIQKNVDTDLDLNEQIFNIGQLSNGKFILQYSEHFSNVNTHINLQRLNSHLQTIDNQSNNEEGQKQEHGDMCILPSGDIIIMWNENNSMYGSLYNGVTFELQLDFDIAISNDENIKFWGGKCQGFLNGQVIIAYTYTEIDNDRDQGDIKVKIFDRRDFSEIKEFNLVARNLSTEQYPQIQILSDQSFVISYDYYYVPRRGQSRWEVYLRIFQNEGGEFEPLRNEEKVNEGHSSSLGATSNGFIVTYTEGDQDGSEPDVFSRSYYNNGEMIVKGLPVNEFSQGYQNSTDIVVFNDDSYLIVWTGEGDGQFEHSIYGRFYSDYGEPSGGQFLFTTETGDKFSYINPKIQLLEGGNKRILITYLQSETMSVYGKIYQFLDSRECPDTCNKCSLTSQGLYCTECINNKDPLNDCLTCDFNFALEIEGVCMCEEGIDNGNGGCDECPEGKSSDKKGGCECNTGLEENDDGGCRPSFGMGNSNKEENIDVDFINNGINPIIPQKIDDEETSPRNQSDPKEVNQSLIFIVVGAFIGSSCLCCGYISFIKRKKAQKKKKYLQDKLKRLEQQELLESQRKQGQQQEELKEEENMQQQNDNKEEEIIPEKKKKKFYLDSEQPKTNIDINTAEN